MPATPCFRRPTPRLLHRALSLLGVLLLSDCGGGGDPPPTAPPAITTIALSPGAITLTGVGSETTVQATVSPANAEGTLTWRVEHGTIASIAPNGRSATVRALAGGATRVFASAGAVEGSASVTVTPVVRAIVVTPAAVTVAAGATQPLQATLDADPGASPALQWATSAPAIATVSTAGVVSGIAPGTATVTVTSVATPAVTRQVDVTVTPPAVTVSLTPAAADLFIGETRTLVPTVTAPPGVATTVGYTSSAPAVAAVSATGVVTAVAPGEATISATSTANAAAVGRATITVRERTVRSVRFELPASLVVGTSATAVVTVEADPGASTALTWSSSNTAVATVSSSGVVLAVAPGSARIMATSVIAPNIRHERDITVSAPTFPIQWRATTDGVIGPLDVQGAYAAHGMLPDGTWIVAGLAGAIAERAPDGSWRRATAPAATDLLAVTVAGGEAWVAGRGGVILRRRPDGTYVTETSGVTADLGSISVAADGRGLAAAVDNAVLLERAANGSWTPLDRPVTTTSGPVVVATATEWFVLYATVANGSSTAPGLYRRTGSTWAPIARRVTTEGYGTMFAIGDAELLVGGNEDFRGIINRWSNGTWVREYTDPGPQATARSAGSFSRCLDGTVLGGVNFGAGLVRSGGSWTTRPGAAAEAGYRTSACATPATLLQLESGAAVRVQGAERRYEILRLNLDRLGYDGGQLAFAGQRARAIAMRWDGVSWSAFSLPDHGLFNTTNGPNFAVWGSNAALALSAGQEGLWNGTGFTWTPRNVPAGSIWGSSLSDVWTADGSSPSGVHRRLGGVWSQVATTGSLVRGAGSAVFASPQTGQIARWTGAAFVNAPLPSSFAVVSDMQVFSATSALAISGTLVYRWDGTPWTSMPLPGLTGTLTAIAGRSDDEFYLFNTLGDQFGCTRVACTRVQRLPHPVRRAIMAGDRGMAVGDSGMVVYGTLGAAMRRR